MLRLFPLAFALALAAVPAAQPAFPDSLDLFLMAGQSNAVGAGGNPALAPTPARGTAYLVRVLTDSLGPQGGPFVELVTVRPNTLVGGTALPTFAVEYAERTGRPTAFLQTAFGGTSNVAAADRGRGHWSARELGPGAGGGPNRFQLAIDLLDAFLENAPDGMPALRLAGLFWIQGETDAHEIDRGRIRTADYRQDFRATLTALADTLAARAGYPVPIYVVQIGHLASGDTPGFEQVRAVQADSEAAAGYSLVCDHAHTFPEIGLMADDAHWNQLGLNHAGLELAVAAAADAPPRPVNTADEDGPAPAPLRVLGNPGRRGARFSAPVTGVVVDARGRVVARLDGALATPELAPGTYAVRTAAGAVRFTIAR
ncbi:sialate O-acetylesterase [Rubrivirga sp. IMCC45206]|uniref:sialate O-acetylesterase n=1 Tax=Rubrivirga sp. IMCC45206 TaxID=3391614 RepID=UPI00398FBDD8